MSSTDSEEMAVATSTRWNQNRTEDIYAMQQSEPVFCVSEPWFYSTMTRKEATDRLQKFASVDGVFLVRPSQRIPGSFMLSFISNERVKHVPIFVVDESAQISLSLDGRTKFYGLRQLIEFYQLNIGCLPTKLTHFLVHR